MKRFSTKLPIWYQLAQVLRSDIMLGRIAPGERLESEIRMAKRYDISVIPVRQALRALEAEALIVRHRGSGTFVNENLQTGKANTSLEALYSREFSRPAKILARTLGPVPDWLTPHFVGLSEATIIRRLAFHGETSWSYVLQYFPQELAEKMTDSLLEQYPTYRLLQEIHGLELARSHFEASAVSASEEVANHTGVEPFSPVLGLRCVTFDPQDRAIGAFDMVFPGEPFIFSFDTAHKL